MIGVQWTGTDGSVWDLMTGPSVHLLPGVRGLGKPKAKDQAVTTAGQDGQSYQGYTLEPRSVFLPLRWEGAANADPEGVQRAWWAACKVGRYGVLRITGESGAYRELRMRPVDDSDIVLTADPFVVGLPFGVNFIADQPWWEGPAIEALYRLGVDAGDDFLGDDPASKDYVFSITASSGSGQQAITNPGEQPAWPVVTVEQANATAFRIGVDGAYVGGPVAVNGGRTLYVDTDKRRQVAYLDDLSVAANRVTRQLTEVNFAPVPAGGTSNLYLGITGTGIVRARFRPRYERAL